MAADSSAKPTPLPTIQRADGRDEAPIRVLHVVESYSSGVAAALQSYIAASAAEIDHEILGFCRPNAQIGDRPTRGFTELPSGRFAQFRAIRTYLSHTQVDVIHAHSSWAGLFTRVRRSSNRIPITYSPHCYAFERTDIRRPTRLVYRRIERMLAHNTDRVIAVGQREADLALQLRPRGQVSVVPHAVPDVMRQRLRSSSTAPRPPGPLVIATMARATAQKGADFFIDVVRAVRRTCDQQVVFVWIGGGNAEITARLRSAGIDVTEWLEQREAITRLSNIDIYIHTAEWEASWPLSLLEAAHLGRPLISRRIPSSQGLPEWLLVDSPDEMAGRIVALATSPEALGRARRAAIEFADALPTSADQAAALASAYRQTIVVR